jgi:nucleoid-associated protein YgaU
MVVALLGLAVLTAARPTEGAGPDTVYVVQPGDTLWEIATARYAGDPREAVWRIEQANGLDSSALTPGMELRLP